MIFSDVLESDALEKWSSDGDARPMIFE